VEPPPTVGTGSLPGKVVGESPTKVVSESPIKDLVECRSDAEYADRPLALMWQGRRLEIKEILERWRSPDQKGFRIKTTEGQAFELIYREIPDDWQIHPI
jgi:hypothetical protein